MFQSATLKLTGWYLLILMGISIIFSVAIYQIMMSQISLRLERYETVYESTAGLLLKPQDAFKLSEMGDAGHAIILALVYANILILVGGGIGSYMMARRALRPIEEAHDAQSRFTSDASHELRTPLAAMKTEIEVSLRDKKATTAELRDVLQSNLEEIEKLSRLSEMLLNLSRLDHDKLERSAVSLPALVNDVIKLYDQPASRIALTTPKKLLVHGNKTAIRELLSILIDNALKYSPVDSIVAIALSSKGKSVLVSIKNEGEGIEPHKLPHIFDRFYQADASRTDQTDRGFGLGLSIAKKIVELHNGELTVSSSPDVTEFTVLLPRHEGRVKKAKNTT